MTIIGSARIDERGKASGGKAGDQKQKSVPDYKGEVSMQPFYDVGKWGYVVRAILPTVAGSIALSMTIACNNPNIGYNQARRLDIIKVGTRTTTPTSCDCSSLVRQCVREAGIEVGNFTTANEVSVLMATGQFEKIAYKKGMALFLGDILVTRVKGHTVVVTSGATRPIENQIAKPTLKKGCKGGEVSILQQNLNAVLGIKLDVDGDFGKNTDKAVRKFQNDYMGAKEADGIYGLKSYAKMKQLLN